MLRRKYILLLGLLMFGIPKLTHAQVNFVTGALTAQAAACPTSPGPSSSSTSALTISTVGYGGATFTLGSSAFSATVSFYGSGDGGTTWQPLNAVASNATSAVLLATATGVFQTNVSGYTNVCMVVTTFVSGTVTARIQLSTISARAGGGVSGGGLPAGCTQPLSAQIMCANFIATSAFNNVGAAAQTMILHGSGDCNGTTCNNTNEVGFQAAPTNTGNPIWTLPTADGVAGQTYQTNGSLALSWGFTAPGGPLAFNAMSPAYGVLADAQINWAPSWSSGSNIVTCSTCNFTGTDTLGRPIAKVGQIVFGTNAQPIGGPTQSTSVVQLPQTTIQSIDSATQIHTVGNANANWTVGPLIWGDDDTTPLLNAWTAASNACGVLQLPAGRMLVQKGMFITSPTTQCSSNDPANRQGPSVIGASLSISMIIPTPNFDPTTCVGPNATGVACFLATGTVSGVHGGGMNVGNWEIWGAGNSAIGSGFNGKHGVEFQGGASGTNWTILGWGGNTSGFVGLVVVDIPVSLSNVQSDGVGQIPCEVNTSTSILAGVSFNAVYCGDQAGTNPNLKVLSSGVQSTNSYYFPLPPGGGCAVEVTGPGAIFQSTGDDIGSSVGSGEGICVDGGTSTAQLSSDNILATASGTNYGAYVQSGTNKLMASTTVFQGGSTGAAVFTNGSPAVFEDGGGNTFNGTTKFGGTGTLAGANVVNGSCTGTATAASTLGLYSLGEFTATTCTSTTTNLGITISSVGTLDFLSVTAGTGGVNASSGVVTVLKNGAAQTITCTLGTGTSCIDATHSVAVAVGDIVSIQFTTQAAETLANVKANLHVSR